MKICRTCKKELSLSCFSTQFSKIYNKSYYNNDCNDCKKLLNRQNYERHKASKKEVMNDRSRKYYWDNRKSELDRCKIYRSENKHVSRDYYLKNKERLKNLSIIKKYGISLEDKQKMLEEQNFKCMISGTRISFDDCHIDHCHETNKVRGLLCYNCNTGLGKFRDNPKILIEAANYIKRHKQQ